jgi:hypothetical protein
MRIPFIDAAVDREIAEERKHQVTYSPLPDITVWELSMIFKLPLVRPCLRRAGMS